MRVLLVTHFFPPGHLGGTEVLTLGLAQSLQAAGHTVRVICAEDWDTAPSYKIQHTDDVFQGVPVRRLHFNWLKAPDVFRYLYNNPEVERHVAHFLGQIQPDIVHIASCYTLSASVISAACSFRIPTILTATDFWFLCARNTLLRSDDFLCSGPEDPWQCARCMLSNAKAYRWPRKVLPERAVATLLQTIGQYPFLTRQRGLRGMLGDWEDKFSFLSQALRKVDRIITASHFLKTLFIKYGVPPERIEFSAYGLDTSWAKGHETKTSSSQLRIGFIGQILPFKGPDILVKAFASLKPDIPVQLKIYGDPAKAPDYGQRLKELAAGDSRIAFLGTFDNSLMGEVLSGIDVLAVPSTWYDFPLVIPSAFATKAPVLATDLPGMSELVQHNVNGLLFERYDWMGLAQQIQRLVDEPDLLERLRAGIAPVKTLRQMTEEYLIVYTSLLSGGPSLAAEEARLQEGTPLVLSGA
jgi:glycosyltransferase involved in cell wall biosynthesis